MGNTCARLANWLEVWEEEERIVIPPSELSGRRGQTTVMAAASTLLCEIHTSDIKNLISIYKTRAEEIINHELYDPEAYELEGIAQELSDMEVNLRWVIDELEFLEDMMDNTAVKEKMRNVQSSYDLIKSTFTHIPGYVTTAWFHLNEEIEAVAAAQQDMVEETEAPVTALSIEETTLKSIEFKQEHIDQGRVDCSVCLDAFKLTVNLQQCPQCKQFFHEHCILQNLQSWQTCPLCRYNHEK